MTRLSTHILSVVRISLMIVLLALALAASARPAGAADAACSDTAARYPMLIGSGYEGTPCRVADAACSDTAARYPMLIGSGYEGEPCAPATVAGALDAAARSSSRVALTVAALATTSPTWDETMLDGSGYEHQATTTALSGQDRD
jgi:hypothetical protein